MNASDQSTIRPNAINLMGRIGFPVRRGVKRDAFASGKRRNAAGEQNNPGQMVPLGRIAL